MPAMVPRVALLAMVLVPLLAGCLSSPLQPPPGLPGLAGLPPIATLRCPPALNGTCNLLATIEPERQGNEVTIAVNPTKPDNVIAGAKDYFPASAGDCVWDGAYHTHDGAAFESMSLPGSPWLLLSDPGSFEPTPLSQYWCLTDPVVAFGPDGTAYYSVLAYQGDPVTGSKLGAGVLPQGGLNDFALNRVTQAVLISRDGGDTWPTISLIDHGTFPLNFHDRQWIEVDQRNGNVYVAWTSILLPGNIFYRSTDGGQTWDLPVMLDPVPIAGSGPGGMFVAVGSQGVVYVSGCSGGPSVAVSPDEGQSFTPWAQAIDDRDEGMDAEYRSGQVCMVAADDTDGPLAGNVYLAWSSTRNGDRDIWFARSEDQGATWSEPAQLNTGGEGSDQFFPAIAVNPGGVVDVVWYTRQHDPANRLLDLAHTYSLDGGRTWAPNLRVTEVSSDPVHSHHQNGMVFIGDYIDIDSSAACAWPAWVDTRAGKADVMTACLQRPGEAG